MQGHRPSSRGSRRWNLVIWHSSMQNGLMTIWTLPGHVAACIPNIVGCCFCCRQVETPPHAETARKGCVDPTERSKGSTSSPGAWASRETRPRPSQPRCRGYMPRSLLHDVQEEDNLLVLGIVSQRSHETVRCHGGHFRSGNFSF
jgi:hypothetical protein